MHQADSTRKDEERTEKWILATNGKPRMETREDKEDTSVVGWNERVHEEQANKLAWREWSAKVPDVQSNVLEKATTTSPPSMNVASMPREVHACSTFLLFEEYKTSLRGRALIAC